jgi:hypothetical protein
LILVVFGASSVCADEEPLDRVTFAQARLWVRQLDDRSFDVRMNATEELVRGGAAAVPGLVDGLLGGMSAEAQLRAIEVLERVALSRREEDQSAAQGALVELSTCGSEPVARRVKVVLRTLAQLRRHRAVARLRELGAEVQFGIADTTPVLWQVPVEPRIELLQVGRDFQGTDEDAWLVSELKEVEEVELEGEAITDAYLEQVSKLGGVSALFIRRARVTDASLAKLARMASLSHLRIWYTPITDASIQLFAKLHGKLELYGTRVTDEGMTRLRRLQRDLEIDFRHGGFLGVGPNLLGGEADLSGCIIGTVTDGSAAEKSGLRKDDVIIRYDGEQVETFEGLRGLIAGNRPGDSVEIEYRRGGDVARVQVELGEWR